MALEVLTNPALLTLICGFQRGVPLWVVDYECMFSSIDLSLPRNDRVKQSMETTGLLPRLAFENHDLVTLEKLLALSKSEYCQAHAKFRFDTSFDDAARIGDLEVVQWLCDVGAATYEHGTIVSTALNGHVDVMLWLLANCPESNEELTTNLMDSVAGNGHLNVVHVLHEWSAEGCTTQAMDGAAANGHLDVVVFLHEHRMEGCTTAAIDHAARNGHLHVIEWLLLLRVEGFTEDASVGAIMNNHEEVLQCLWENRCIHQESELRAGICKAVPQALPAMSLAMAVLLYEAVPEAFPVDAILLAQSGGQQEVADYLRSIGSFREGSDASLLSAIGSQAYGEAESLLDREVFNIEVLRDAMDASMKVSTSDTTMTEQDPVAFALQIRLRQLIDQQTPVEPDSLAASLLPMKIAGKKSGSRRSQHD